MKAQKVVLKRKSTLKFKKTHRNLQLVESIELIEI